MINKVIILICGFKGTGKDTVAMKLIDGINLNYNYRAFLSPNAFEVKKIAHNIFGWDFVKDTRGRKLLVDITNAGYNYKPTFWEELNYVSMQGNFDRTSSVNFFIIPDWRYKVTEDFFKGIPSCKVVTIRVNKYVDITEDLDNSEKDFRNFKVDYEIDNNGFIEDLFKAVSDLLEANFKKWVGEN